MEREKVAEFINKVVIVQGEIQRIMIWMRRLHKDIDEFKKEVLKDERSDHA